MTAIWLIARRELQGYLTAPVGYIIIAAILLLDGLLFNAFAMTGERLSYEVMHNFFYFLSGTTMVASILITMRLFAEERQMGTLVVLQTSPCTEWQMVLGKFFGAYILLLLLTGATLYMPLLILVNGTVTWGHLFTGYLGLALLGAACVAIGTFASSIAPTQILAAIVSSCIIVALLLLWMLARQVEGPLSAVLSYMSLWDKHFQPFSRGIVRSQAIFYYLSLTYAALIGTVAVIGGRRWRG